MTNNERNAVQNFLDEAYDSDLMNIVSEIVGYNGELDSMLWYDMDDFDEMCADMTPSEIANCIFYGDFKPCHAYFKYDGAGNFESTDFVTFDDADRSEIIDAIDNIPYRHLPAIIQDIFDEVEEQEAEEKEREEAEFEEYCNAHDCDCEHCPLYHEQGLCEDAFHQRKVGSLI